MSIELRIKSKHLALEPAIIKFEEEKLKRQIKWLRAKGEDTSALQTKLYSLINHRKIDVANEARATFLARAFIRGLPYSGVERNSNVNGYIFRGKILPRVAAMAYKYGSNKTTHADIVKWVTETK